MTSRVGRNVASRTLVKVSAKLLLPVQKASWRLREYRAPGRGLPTYRSEVHLDHLRLTSVPDRIRTAFSLARLDLSSNRLTALPGWLGKFSRLRILDVSNNKLTAVPKSLGNLSQLDALDLSGNQLTSVPQSLGKLTQLRNLNLSGNRLSSVPESLGNLTRLETLDLSGNRLTWIPQQLADLAEDGLQLNVADNRQQPLTAQAAPNAWSGQLLDRAWARLRPLFAPSVSLDAVLGAADMNDPGAAVLQLYTWERDGVMTLAKGTAGAAITVLTGLIAAAVEGKIAAGTVVLFLAA